MASGVACPEISPVKGAAAGTEGPKAGVGNRAFPSAKFRTVWGAGGISPSTMAPLTLYSSGMQRSTVGGPHGTFTLQA